MDYQLTWHNHECFCTKTCLLHWCRTDSEHKNALRFLCLISRFKSLVARLAEVASRSLPKRQALTLFRQQYLVMYQLDVHPFKQRLCKHPRRVSLAFTTFPFQKSGFSKHRRRYSHFSSSVQKTSKTYTEEKLKQRWNCEVQGKATF